MSLLGCRRRIVSLFAKLVPFHWQTQFGAGAAYMPLDASSTAYTPGIPGADAAKLSDKWWPRRPRLLAALVALLVVLALALGLGLGLGLKVCLSSALSSGAHRLRLTTTESR